LYVYKKFNFTNLVSKKSGALGVEEILSLTPRKSLYVVRAGNEKFLIAGDMERTTLISKLDSQDSQKIKELKDPVFLKSFEPENVEPIEKQPVMKNLLKKLYGKG